MLNKILSTQTGCPVDHNKNSLTCGPNGPVLLQDTVLVDKIQHFTREKIPTRNVHALGTGVYGQFIVKNDISNYTKAKLFSHVGKKTDIFVRFSGIFTEQGDAETIRDPRGFAIKFYTEEGNWDLLAINTPVFNVRDGKLGPDAVHAFKRDPRNNELNPTLKWDYAVNHPESLHHIMMLFTDEIGTPMSYRYMHAYGCNTFSFINSNNERFWIKFHLISPLGCKGFDKCQANTIAGEEPAFLTKDMRYAICMGEYPKWKLCCQIMQEEDGYKNNFAFDATKIWKHKDYPLIDIGEIELNKLPIDYFSEVEQVAFSPANVVPGIGFSPDKLLQGRLMVYDDAQNHRIGPNYKELHINCPVVETNNYYTGGSHQLKIKNNFPNYFPSYYGGPQPIQSLAEPPLRCDGPADYYDYPGEGTDTDFFDQPNAFFKILDETQRRNLCANIACSLIKVEEAIVKKNIQNFYKIDLKFGEMVESCLKHEKELIKDKFSEKMFEQLLKVKTTI